MWAKMTQKCVQMKKDCLFRLYKLDHSQNARNIRIDHCYSRELPVDRRAVKCTEHIPKVTRGAAAACGVAGTLGDLGDELPLAAELDTRQGLYDVFEDPFVGTTSVDDGAYLADAVASRKRVNVNDNKDGTKSLANHKFVEQFAAEMHGSLSQNYYVIRNNKRARLRTDVFDLADLDPSEGIYSERTVEESSDSGVASPAASDRLSGSEFDLDEWPLLLSDTGEPPLRSVPAGCDRARASVTPPREVAGSLYRQKPRVVVLPQTGVDAGGRPSTKRCVKPSVRLREYFVGHERSPDPADVTSPSPTLMNLLLQDSPGRASSTSDAISGSSRCRRGRGRSTSGQRKQAADVEPPSTQYSIDYKGSGRFHVQARPSAAPHHQAAPPPRRPPAARTPAGRPPAARPRLPAGRRQRAALGKNSPFYARQSAPVLISGIGGARSTCNVPVKLSDLSHVHDRGKRCLRCKLRRLRPHLVPSRPRKPARLGAKHLGRKSGGEARGVPVRHSTSSDDSSQDDRKDSRLSGATGRVKRKYTKKIPKSASAAVTARIKNKYETAKSSSLRTEVTSDEAAGGEPGETKTADQLKRKGALRALDVIRKRRFLSRSRSASTSSMLSQLKERQERRRRGEQAYDIDNIVIPYSMAANTRVEKLSYKEILVPKWREKDICAAKVRSQEDSKSSEQPESPAAAPVTFTLEPVMITTESGDEIEDLSDYVFAQRHGKSEASEKLRYLNFAGPNPAPRRRGAQRADSDSASRSRAGTPDSSAPSPNTSYSECALTQSLPSALAHREERLSPVMRSRADSTSSTRSEDEARRVTSSAPAERRRAEDRRSTSGLMETIYLDSGLPPWPKRTFPLDEEELAELTREASAPVRPLPRMRTESAPEAVTETASPGGSDTESEDPECDDDPTDPEWTVNEVDTKQDHLVLRLAKR